MSVRPPPFVVVEALPPVRGEVLEDWCRRVGERACRARFFAVLRAVARSKEVRRAS